MSKSDEKSKGGRDGEEEEEERYVCIYEDGLILRVKVDEDLMKEGREQFKKEKEEMKQRIKEHPEIILNKETLDDIEDDLKSDDYFNLTPEQVSMVMKYLHKHPEIYVDYDEFEEVIVKIKNGELEVD